MVFVRLERYDEAASAFESALKLKPERTNLQWSLASAYLKAGKGDKAAALFRKLAESDAEPRTFNNVAYELAEQDTQLPLAIQFAEKAVRAEEDRSEERRVGKECRSR